HCDRSKSVGLGFAPRSVKQEKWRAKPGSSESPKPWPVGGCRRPIAVIQDTAMPRAALLVPCLTDADAVSNDVLGMYRVLEARGYDVCIFAFFWNVSGPRVRHFSKIDRFIDDPSALLIYHHSTGWGEALQIVSQARCRR